MKFVTRVLERFGNDWGTRLMVLFVAVGVAFNINSQHKVRNDFILVAIVSAVLIPVRFWQRHKLRQQGIDADADDIADAREEVRNIFHSRPDLAPRKKGLGPRRLR